MIRFVCGMMLIAPIFITNVAGADPEPKIEQNAKATTSADELYVQAISLAPGGDKDAILSALEKSLAAGASPTRVLTEKAFLPLHENPSFRNLIRRFATQSETTIVVVDEPGKPLAVRGRILNQEGTPVEDARIYVYQTGISGSYSSSGGNAADMGDSLNPRIFGFLRSDKDGNYSFKTIRPGQYPNDGPPAHIHYEVRTRGYEAVVTELMFTDDSRMNEEAREFAKRAGYGLCQPTRDENGVDQCVFDIRLTRHGKVID